MGNAILATFKLPRSAEFFKEQTSSVYYMHKAEMQVIYIYS